MTAANTIDLSRHVTDSPDDAVATMALSWAEILIVTYFRGGKVSAEQLEAALALGKAGARPVV